MVAPPWTSTPAQDVHLHHLPRLRRSSSGSQHHSLPLNLRRPRMCCCCHRLHRYHSCHVRHQRFQDGTRRKGGNGPWRQNWPRSHIHGNPTVRRGRCGRCRPATANSRCGHWAWPPPRPKCTAGRSDVHGVAGRHPPGATGPWRTPVACVAACATQARLRAAPWYEDGRGPTHRAAAAAGSKEERG